ncbi:protein of unknown function [Dyella jiangningensis]|uniref:DUF802 domain-containing protein n=1 Tax=Dyella sp. AtDHG13 TaxID=1938897 RepID=UPI00087E8FB9|nr:DUF802 domain-containing protein [Dyella sp. AtDHG13]PXV56050.1 uncharacterized protein DUF802 [Dyella sp. AtDHG13]SDK69814.1 protein of unknown function [Dyella jiangningensis]
MKNLLNLAVFAVGLAAVCWVGVGYIGSNPLGAAVAVVIGACYVAGALELHRYRQATATLAQALSDTATAPNGLGEWLARLHPSLRNAVRLRVEGERVAMPAPAMTPYLVGLLVLLGMLGTLLGMMATLRGTGLALESASDLQAIRGSLAAPVKGLGFAFGTSIAGVATSAMLGLLSALCRRERLQATQRLDATIATGLRVHSQAHQREESFKLLQQQTALMPALVDRLQAMMLALEQHGAQMSERQLAGQEAFHARTEAAYTHLAASVQQSLKESVAESARAATAMLQQGLAANEQQLASHEAFHARAEAAYTHLAASVEQSLKDSVAESARASSATLRPVVEATMAGLARETASLHGVVTQAVQQQLEGLTSGFAHATTTVSEIWNQALAEHRQASAAAAEDLRGSLTHFTDTFEQRSAALLDGLAGRLDITADSVANAWSNALSQQAAVNDELAARNQQALAAAAATFETHASTFAGSVRESHAALQATLESRDEQRLAAWSESFGAITRTLGQQWEQVGEQTARRQQDICDTLARTASDITAQAQSHASETIAEISRLVQAASEALKAAAEVVAELRQKLSDSMVRDTAMLEERSRLLATLETLLDAVNHASTEQREAVDALVSTSADLLDRVGTRFTDHIQAETGKLGAVAAQVTGSAAEVASLGEAFGAAVHLYGQSNEALMERLQHIADALDKTLSRSDEQLAYYVAQAREVVDLSMLSQKQVIEDLRQIADQRASAGTENA